MDEIQTRLTEISEKCVQSYEAWRKGMSDEALRETLQENIHELRKVASRLEIEIAMSERDRMASKPIPIPPHRSARRGKGHVSEDNNETLSPSDRQDSSAPVTEVKKITRRPRKPKAANGDD